MIDDLLAVLRPNWPDDWTTDHLVYAALECLIEDLRQGRPTSLPVVQVSKGQIGWLSMGPSGRELRDYLEDAKGWLVRADAREIGGQISTAPASASPLAPMLAVLSPQGYARWNTTLDRGKALLIRLAKMQHFLASRPHKSHRRIPSLPALRLEFITALRVGDWVRAEACVEEIDHWNLAHATDTLQMRVRLYAAQGDTAELFNFAVKHRVWNIPNPRRIAAALVNAIDACVIEPVEVREGLATAYTLFCQHWYPQIVHCIHAARGEPDALRLLAFAAVADGDSPYLNQLLPDLPPVLAQFLQAQLPGDPSGLATVAPPEPSQPSTMAEPASAFWVSLHQAVTHGRARHVRELIGSLDAEHYNDLDFIAAAPDALLELLSDPALAERNVAQLLLYEVLAAVIDTFIMAPGFPRITHLGIYLALLDGLVSLRGAAANDADSQLVLGLVAAAANLDAGACPRCAQIVSDWWQRRPIVQRLDWLAGALDTLAQLCSDTALLVSLYADALTLAARKGLVLTKAEASIWRNIGQTLELSSADVIHYLQPLLPPDASAQQDPLAQFALRQIAIVSLREASAQEAAQQLEARTGAKVSVVSAFVAGAETRHALTADLILYVWAATSHATYRAFDGWRDKLEYVQGTGASSIVLAAERWALRQSQHA
jgi:hypothetical protein